MERATIVVDSETPADVVTMHSRVKFRDCDSGEEQVCTLVYPGERDLFDDALSVITPIGAALIGLAEGQSLAYPGPDGSQKTVTVVRILYQPEANKRASRPALPTAADPVPCKGAQPDILDGEGHLKPRYYEDICRVLGRTASILNRTQQGEVLAKEIGHPESLEIWALLMWNSRPSPELTARLQRWIADGMPLRRPDGGWPDAQHQIWFRPRSVAG
jgi:regulator of nucleoside diphosphate kinase